MFSKYLSKPESSQTDDQGDIFSKLRFDAIDVEIECVLVTPICDIANAKAEYLHFCAVLPFDILFSNIIKERGDLKLSIDEFRSNCSASKEKIIKDQVLTKLINNNFNRFQWLGTIPTLEKYWYVDFQLTQCYPITKLADIHALRIAKASSPLRESIFVRYSAYMSRLGLDGTEEEITSYANEIFNAMKS